MIQEVTLGNFQGFSSLQKFRLAPLTLIFGPNSSGKSSISRSILLLQQSLNGFNANNGNLIYRGSSIDLASYSNVIYRHNLDNDLTIGVRVPAASPASINTRIGTRARRPISAPILPSEVFCQFLLSGDALKKVKYEYVFENAGGNDWHEPSTQPRQLLIEFENIDNEAFKVHLLEGLDLLDELYIHQLAGRGTDYPADLRPGNDIDLNDSRTTPADWAEALSLVRFRGLFPIFTVATFGESKEKLVIMSEVLEMLFRSCRISLTRALDGVSHVKPLREIPDRLLIVDETDDSGSRRTMREQRERSADIVSSWVTQLTNGQYELRTEEFSSKEVGFLGTLRAKHLFDLKTKTPVSFKDVGVGLSQVIPIMEALDVAQRRTPRNSTKLTQTVLIEQPELHLHPRMQADLMDLVIGICKQEDLGVQVIAETHSENMVLRLQKRIRDGQLDSKDVAILYADQDPSGGNRITELRMNEDGDFESEWPLSFAEVRVQDLF